MRPSESDAPRVRVVLADDHPDLVAVCRRLLEPEFSVVGIAHDGREALEKVAELAPDVLVLDLEMPVMKGDDVLAALRRERAAVSVVVLTLHGDAAIANRMAELGARGFVTKVRMARDLARTIREAAASAAP